MVLLSECVQASSFSTGRVSSLSAGCGGGLAPGRLHGRLSAPAAVAVTSASHAIGAERRMQMRFRFQIDFDLVLSSREADGIGDGGLPYPIP